VGDRAGEKAKYVVVINSPESPEHEKFWPTDTIGLSRVVYENIIKIYVFWCLFSARQYYV